MDRGRVGEDRGSKETDGCPLTVSQAGELTIWYDDDARKWLTLGGGAGFLVEEKMGYLVGVGQSLSAL
jgi:hypothetical protein